VKSSLNKLERKVLRCLCFLLIFGHVQSVFANGCWTNADLSALEKTQANAFIYVWSPRMALSVLHANEVAKQADAAGLLFVPVVDGRIPDAEWRAALQSLGTTKSEGPQRLKATRPLCASRLTALDAYQHFPSVFLVREGELQREKWTGAMNAATWADAIKADLMRQRPTVSETVPAAPHAAAPAAKHLLPVSDVKSSKVPPSAGCIAANQFISLPPELAGRGSDQAVALGAYERISPDGRFVLRSFSGKDLSAVSLIELPEPSARPNPSSAQVVAITQTPLSNEAFPVQGSWRYVVDTSGQHYTFSDLLQKQKQATPYFRGGMSGFYAAAAEVGSTYPLRSREPVLIRSLSWPNGGIDSDTAGEGMLTTRTIKVAPDQNSLLSDSGRANLCLGRVAVDGSLYSLPMISVDGEHFSALPQRPINNVSTMRIFGFGADGKQCLPEQQFTSPSGKVAFGFTPKQAQAPSQQLQADLVYEYRGQAWWYASRFAVALNLAPVEDRPANPQEKYRQKILASAFPGLTRDGRVIYAATWQLCSGSACSEEGGYVITDPYQSNAYQQHLQAQKTGVNAATSSQSCITRNDVLRERADFANFHGLAAR
jgi:hypothetical protein